jgi:sucrose-6-phosphate hydrolase SacC (GH32 family)
MAMLPSMSGGMCFSGGGAVDFNNTLGFQKGDTKTLFVTFTAKGGGGERLAWSTNKGKSWIIPEGKLFSHNGRDPKPFWHEPSQHWVIAVYNDSQDRGGRNISIYTSTDLKNWDYQSAVPGFFECPELFELPIDGDPANTRWVLMGANAKYLVGQFDGKNFTPEHQEQKETIVGKIKTAIYAGQCFSNAPDGRIIYIGWAGMGGPDKSSPFHNGFTVPIHLTLRSSPDGPRLNSKPIAEFDQLRAGKAFSAIGKILDDEDAVLSAKAPAQEYDIVLRLSSTSKDGIAKLRIGGTVIPVDLTRDDPNWRFATESNVAGTAVIRIICDRPFMEVVSGNGRRYQLINRADRGQPLGEISLTHSQESIQIEEFTVYRMKSIWK